MTPNPARARAEKRLAKRYEAVFVRRDLSAGYDPTSAIDELVGIAADAIEKAVRAFYVQEIALTRDPYELEKLDIPWDAVIEEGE